MSSTVTIRQSQLSPYPNQTSNISNIQSYTAKTIAEKSDKTKSSTGSGGSNSTNTNDEPLCYTDSSSDDDQIYEGRHEFFCGTCGNLRTSPIGSLLKLPEDQYNRYRSVKQVFNEVLYQGTKLKEKVRKCISQDANRYKDSRLKNSLDFTYIEMRIVAMGFPSRGIEGYYRNHMQEVEKHLNNKHGKYYRVYNLCAEKDRRYEKNRFNGNWVQYGFRDHCPPSYKLMVDFVTDATKWLSKDKNNIVVIHCKAGKGRTGCMICVLLIYISYLVKKSEKEDISKSFTKVGGAECGSVTDVSKEKRNKWDSGCSTSSIQVSAQGLDCVNSIDDLVLKDMLTTEQALQYYGSRRIKTSRGVTVPSQKRAIRYFEAALKYNLQYVKTECRFLKISLINLPKCYKEDIYFIMKQKNQNGKYIYVTDNEKILKEDGRTERWEIPKNFQTRNKRSKDEDGVKTTFDFLKFEAAVGSTISGDILIEFYLKSIHKGKPIFAAYFDTYFHSLKPNYQEDVDRLTPTLSEPLQFQNFPLLAKYCDCNIKPLTIENNQNKLNNNHNSNIQYPTNFTVFHTCSTAVKSNNICDNIYTGDENNKSSIIRDNHRKVQKVQETSDRTLHSIAESEVVDKNLSSNNYSNYHRDATTQNKCNGDKYDKIVEKEVDNVIEGKRFQCTSINKNYPNPDKTYLQNEHFVNIPKSQIAASRDDGPLTPNQNNNNYNKDIKIGVTESQMSDSNSCDSSKLIQSSSNQINSAIVANNGLNNNILVKNAKTFVENSNMDSTLPRISPTAERTNMDSERTIIDSPTGENNELRDHVNDNYNEVNLRTKRRNSPVLFELPFTNPLNMKRISNIQTPFEEEYPDYPATAGKVNYKHYRMMFEEFDNDVIKHLDNELFEKRKRIYKDRKMKEHLMKTGHTNVTFEGEGVPFDYPKYKTPVQEFTFESYLKTTRYQSRTSTHESTERNVTFSRDELDNFSKSKELKKKFSPNFQVLVCIQDTPEKIEKCENIAEEIRNREIIEKRNRKNEALAHWEKHPHKIDFKSFSLVYNYLNENCQTPNLDQPNIPKLQDIQNMKNGTSVNEVCNMQVDNDG